MRGIVPSVMRVMAQLPSLDIDVDELSLRQELRDAVANAMAVSVNIFDRTVMACYIIECKNTYIISYNLLFDCCFM